MKINFVMLNAPKITGGPLAILEYANRLNDRGHSVSITTTPPFCWEGSSPFPWFDFKGKIYYDDIAMSSKRLKFKLDQPVAKIYRAGVECLRSIKHYQKLKQLAHDMDTNVYRKITNRVARNGGLAGMLSLFSAPSTEKEMARSLHPLLADLIMWQYLMNAMPECDLNIATLWSTLFPVFYSGKGKPVIFMQHYEEIFYDNELFPKLMTRLAYSLPVYKVANSSWLKSEVEKRQGQEIPFSNNAINIHDFNPCPKKSEKDGIIRIFTYSRPEQWKGFGDAAAVMRAIFKKCKRKVNWHVFGYLNPLLPPENPYAPYKYHPKLSFKELSRLYAESDITLCPSWYESFPLPPLESMASGTAVVTTEYGTEDYAFNNINALVVKPRDIESMTEAVLRLIDDNALRDRLASAGRAKAMEFTWDRAVDYREKILFDIHENNIQYDIFEGVKTGLHDFSGIPFESIPSNLDVKNLRLFQDGSGAVYFFDGTCKRHIEYTKLVDMLLKNGEKLMHLDGIAASRIPMGLPISKKADLDMLQATLKNNNL